MSVQGLTSECSDWSAERVSNKIQVPHMYVRKSIFSGSWHFPASLSIAAVHSKTVKRCQIRTANPLVDVHISYSVLFSDVNKDWTCKDKDKDKDKDLTHKDQDKDKDFTYSYLLQVAAKPTIAVKQQQ